MPVILYFASLLLTCALSGVLALYAWRQPPLPGVRAYAGLALSACLLALAESLSMLSSTQAQALLWFNLRFIFTGIMPVIWVALVLAYSGQQGWLSKNLSAGALVVPAITQVALSFGASVTMPRPLSEQKRASCALRPLMLFRKSEGRPPSCWAYPRQWRPS